MLCVTITIVTWFSSSAMVSSIRLVEVGSSAEHGSSMSSTSGETASARPSMLAPIMPDLPYGSTTVRLPSALAPAQENRCGAGAWPWHHTSR